MGKELNIQGPIYKRNCFQWKAYMDLGNWEKNQIYKGRFNFKIISYDEMNGRRMIQY